jgi:2-haloacid dehalogenase
MLNFNDFDVLTFDCYGTLIDWEPGILNALRPIFADHGVQIADEKALELYGELEPQAEHGEYRDYKSVLKLVLQGMGARLGFAPTGDELSRFAYSVKDWLPFTDSTPALSALKKRYKLAIISNIDDDLIAASVQRLQVTFDWIITAQQARSYKPSPNNFLVALQRIGLPSDKLLHVAQSLYHDIAPARSLGLATVWVNRRQGKDGGGATLPVQATPDLEVPDLQTLVEKVSK